MTRPSNRAALLAISLRGTFASADRGTRSPARHLKPQRHAVFVRLRVRAHATAPHPFPFHLTLSLPTPPPLQHRKPPTTPSFDRSLTWHATLKSKPAPSISSNSANARRSSRRTRR